MTVAAADARVAAPASPADSLVKPPTAPPPSDQRRRIERLLLLRTVVVTVVLGLSLWLVAKTEDTARAAVWLQSGVIAATYLSSIVFGVMLRRGWSPGRVARPMLGNDLALTSLLVYSTGGALSPYTFLFALTIVAAGAVAYRRGAVIVTVASLALMVAVALAAWTRVLALPISDQVQPWAQTGRDLARSLGIDLATMIGIGALALIFGDQLQRGAETLATTRQAAADLLNLHRDIVRSLSSGLITTDSAGRILTANAPAAEILGRAVEELAGRPAEGVMPGLTALGGGAPRRGDLSVVAAGHALTLGVTVSPLRDVDDRVIGQVVSFQDLTELRRLEQHARRAERLAIVGQLAAGVAHEIRNPLASISGSIELLRQAPQVTDDDRTLMAIVQREIQRLNGLIGDLLDYANPRPSQPVEFELAGLVEETVRVARGDLAAGELAWDVAIAGPVQLHADPAKLRQVVWNLLRNAVDAARGGGGHVQVAVRGEPGAAVVTVGDDGAGMPEDMVARIFDPFFTTKRTGTGLGLATCHAIVAEHGGRIDVQTAPGKGTKMVVTLPRPG